MTARSFTEALAEPTDYAKKRLAAMNAARHALIALRIAHDVPELATAHGFPVSTGCVTMDLGQMQDDLRRFFLDDVPALIADLDSARDWAAALEGQNARLTAALQKIRDEHGRNPWNPDTVFPTEAAKNWHDGHISTLASHSLIAFEALDPEGWAEHEKDMEAATGDDGDWYRRTGNCGACAVVASACECEGKCGCWELHGPPLEPYKPPETLRAENARLRAELEALRQPALFVAALTGGEGE
jgi:hypothetical protein